MIYLASPYSASDPALMHSRYLWAEEACARLFNAGLYVFSPIMHCHEMIKRHSLRSDFGFWRRYNEHMLDKAETLAILTLKGWEDSKGVKGEIDFWLAYKTSHPVRLDPNSTIHAWTLALSKRPAWLE